MRWLILKTKGDIKAAAQRHGRICLVAVLLAVGVLSLCKPIMSQAIAARWFTWPNALFLASMPLATVLLGRFTWCALGSTVEAAPFLGAMALFVLSGIAISLFPMIVPYHFTLSGGGLVAAHAGVSAGRDVIPSSRHSDVLGVVVLGVPRQVRAELGYH